MKSTITITVKDLERIIEEAKYNYKRDNSLAMCVELESAKPNDEYAKSDTIRVRQLSGYAECDPKTILYINF